MPDDDNLQEQTGPFAAERTEAAIDPATVLAAVVAAVAGGVAVQVQQIVAAANDLGELTIPVSSQCIEALEFNIGTGELAVHFVDGSLYYYPNFGMYEFLRFLNARSKGGHYNDWVRGKEAFIQGKKKGSRIALGAP